MRDFEKIAEAEGWKKCPPSSEFSWEKWDGTALRTHWKNELYSGRPLKMTAEELCVKERLI